MTSEEYQIILDFREAHKTETGRQVLADTLKELGLLDYDPDGKDVLRNYAVRVIEKMGVVTPGQKYQLLLGIASLLQHIIPELEETNGRE